MDTDLSALRRACVEAPHDTAALVRLASALERAGRVHEAWDLLANTAGSAPSPEPVSAAVAEYLQGRRPALLAFLKTGRVRFARRTVHSIAACGEALVLVALACDPDAEKVRREAAEGCLASLLAPKFPELPRPETLRALVGEVVTARGPWRSHPRWSDLARRIVMTAEHDRELRLVPWVAALAGARNIPISEHASSVFLWLTGCKAPPIDFDRLETR